MHLKEKHEFEFMESQAVRFYSSEKSKESYYFEMKCKGTCGRMLSELSFLRLGAFYCMDGFRALRLHDDQLTKCNQILCAECFGKLDDGGKSRRIKRTKK